MNRKATSAAVAIVTLIAAFGLGQEKGSDSSIDQFQITSCVDIATIDVARVFTKSQKFNAAMAPIRAKFDAFNTGRHHIKKEKPLPAETKAYAETYQRMDEIVTRICKARNIGLVIRATVYSVDAADNASMLQWVNKQIVYSNVPDITDEVIAELDR